MNTDRFLETFDDLIVYWTKPSSMYAKTIATSIGDIVCIKMYVIKTENSTIASDT